MTADHPRGIRAYRDEDPAFDAPTFGQRADPGILGFSSNTGAYILTSFLVTSAVYQTCCMCSSPRWSVELL